MKTTLAILICSLAGSTTGWAYGPYCGPVPRLPPSVIMHHAPAVRVSYYPAPVIYSTRTVYSVPIVYSPPPVIYTSQPAVYVAPVPPPLPPPPVVYQAPVLYSAPAPVVYMQPAYCAPPALQLVAALPLFPFWFGGGHHGGGYRSSWSHGGGPHR